MVPTDLRSFIHHILQPMWCLAGFRSIPPPDQTSSKHSICGRWHIIYTIWCLWKKDFSFTALYKSIIPVSPLL